MIGVREFRADVQSRQEKLYFAICTFRFFEDQFVGAEKVWLSEELTNTFSSSLVSFVRSENVNQHV